MSDICQNQNNAVRNISNQKMRNANLSRDERTVSVEGNKGGRRKRGKEEGRASVTGPREAAF